jgi:hypothetical protein
VLKDHERRRVLEVQLAAAPPYQHKKLLEVEVKKVVEGIISSLASKFADQTIEGVTSTNP